MKKSNTTLALMAAIAASASMAYAATDNGAQKEWLPGRIMSGNVSFYNGDAHNGDSICTICTYDDKGRYVEKELKKYNRETDSFDDNELYSYEYDETTGNGSLMLMKIYDSEVGDYVDRMKTIYTYTKDNVLPAVIERYERSNQNTDWVQIEKTTRSYEYDPVCGKVCKFITASDGYKYTETITYDADGVPQEYVNTTSYYRSAEDNSEYTTTYRNFEWSEGYDVDFSKSQSWQHLTEALEASCKFECQEQTTSVYEGITTTKTKKSKVEYVRSVDNGNLSYERVTDSRADDGKYQVVQYMQLDEWGGYDRKSFSYEGLGVDEAPSQAKLKSQSEYVYSYTSPTDYKIRNWQSDNAQTESYLIYAEDMATTVNPTFGYIENETNTQKRYNADGSLYYTSIVRKDYSDYKELIPNAITRIASDALHPRRIYTTDGVCVGNSTNNLPSGVYIVREGGHSMKVKK